MHDGDEKGRAEQAEFGRMVEAGDEDIIVNSYANAPTSKTIEGVRNNLLNIETARKALERRKGKYPETSATVDEALAELAEIETADSAVEK